MFAHAKEVWSQLKKSPPGKRFELHYEREHRGNRGKVSWSAFLQWMMVAVTFGIGVVLVFIPGPAFVFFALAGGLAASQSRYAARSLDWLEVKGREAVRALRRHAHR